jgi:hypothetical protein
MCCIHRYMNRDQTDARRPVDRPACAKFIGIKTRTLDKYVALGRIPAIRLSQKIVRFDLDDVLAALKRRRPNTGSRATSPTTNDLAL